MTDQQLINTLNTIRKQKGISDADIVRSTGMNKANVSLFFNHKRRPLVSTMLVIMNACGVEKFSELE